MQSATKKRILGLAACAFIALGIADEYPAVRFRGDGSFSGGPVFGYQIAMRTIPFDRAGDYVFHFRGMPNQEMSLLLYVRGKSFDDKDYDELTHVETTIEANLRDRHGRAVCTATGLPLHGDINGNPNGWILQYPPPAYYHANCLRVPMTPSESYTLTIRIRNVDTTTSRINLLPVFEGGQPDLP